MNDKQIEQTNNPVIDLSNIFPLMEQHIVKDIEERFTNDCELLQTEEGLKKFLEYNRLKYQNNVAKKCLRYLTRKKDKRILDARIQLHKVSLAKDFTQDLIITIEWTKSYTWGSNPKAFTNFGYEGSSIGGCGYCKTSTATAEALNSDDRILKLLYMKKEDALSLPTHKLRIKNQYYEKDSNDKVYRTEKMSTSDINRAFLGYGSGYNVIPRFEGGVGVSSHQTICNRLGLMMNSITDTKHVNVYRVYKIIEGVSV